MGYQYAHDWNIAGVRRADGVGLVQFPHEAISFPGKDLGTLGWVVDQIHHKPDEFATATLTPHSLQALHMAAHLDHIESRILPVLAKEACFILDRFWWSTWVYGTVDGVSSEVLNKLVEAEQMARNSTLPAAALTSLGERFGVIKVSWLAAQIQTRTNTTNQTRPLDLLLNLSNSGLTLARLGIWYRYSVDFNFPG